MSHERLYFAVLIVESIANKQAVEKHNQLQPNFCFDLSAIRPVTDAARLHDERATPPR